MLIRETDHPVGGPAFCIDGLIGAVRVFRTLTSESYIIDFPGFRRFDSC